MPRRSDASRAGSLLVAAVVLLGGCGQESRPPVTPTIVAAIPTPASEPTDSATVTATPTKTGGVWTLPPESGPGDSLATPLADDSYVRLMAGYGWDRTSVTQADLTADGHPETILVVAYGQQARGVVVMRGAVVLLATEGVLLTTGHEELQVLHPLALPEDSMNAPSWFYVDRYRWQGGRFVADDEVALRSSDELNGRASGLPQSSQAAATVQLYYLLLHQQRYEAAYRLLSPTLRAVTPLDQWRAGYAHTDAVHVEAVETLPGGEVHVRFTSVERPDAGGTLTRGFEGTWRIVSDSGTPRLDSPAVTEIVDTLELRSLRITLSPPATQPGAIVQVTVWGVDARLLGQMYGGLSFWDSAGGIGEDSVTGDRARDLRGVQPSDPIRFSYRIPRNVLVRRERGDENPSLSVPTSLGWGVIGFDWVQDRIQIPVLITGD